MKEFVLDKRYEEAYVVLLKQGLSNDSYLSDSVPNIELSASGTIPLEKVVAHYEQLSEIMQVQRPVLREGETIYEDRDVEIESAKVAVSVFLRSTQPKLFEAGYAAGTELLQACGQTVNLVAYRLLLDGDQVNVTRFDEDYLTQLRDELGVDMRW